MNNKLKKQLNQITDYDPQARMQKQMMWQQAYYNRQDFIENLNKKIAKLDDEGMFVDKKSKSNYYSDCVVNYDRENMEVF